jgi:Family of unknown function (DUF5947)
VTAYPTLRRLARPASPIPAAAQEPCELCSQPIPSDHRHLLELPGRQVRCVCYPCSVLFNRAHASDPDANPLSQLTAQARALDSAASGVLDQRGDTVGTGVLNEGLQGEPGGVYDERLDSVPGGVLDERLDGPAPGRVLDQPVGGGPPRGETTSAARVASGARFRLIPQRRRYLAGFALTDAEWESLRIPVGIAFVLADGTAFYPGALGATQAFLDPEVWQQVKERNPVLRQMQPEVEALLVNRVGDCREHYLVPIDDCYRLVGVIRTAWRGLTGGREVWSRVDEFFQGVKAHAADR